MAVAPSIVFYVLNNGGTKEQYGFILSAFSFASFCAKPILGWSSDSYGFRIPYITSLVIATLGGLIYLLASAFSSNTIAISAILLSRVLGGIGAASSALGFAYIARCVPHSEQTSTNTLLSTVRIVGMALGPGVNTLLAWVNVDLFHGKWKLDPLNSVGFVLMITNMLALFSIVTLLEEPPAVAPTVVDGNKLTEKGEHNLTSDDDEDDNDENGEAPSTLELGREDSTASQSQQRSDVIRAILSADILVPFLSIFTFNSNFQLVETGFTPAANHALGWGPVETSAALGSISVIIMCNMLIVFHLSSKLKLSNPTLLSIGHGISAMAYTFIYLSWTSHARAWHFLFPLVCSAGSFPFMAAPTRSFFTVAVDSKSALVKYHGTMQALLSMGASVAGFVTPGLVAKYCLRTPSEIDASVNGRELSAWSLFAPVLNSLTLMGVAYVQLFSRGGFSKEEEEEVTNQIIPSQDDEIVSLSKKEDEFLTETAALLGPTVDNRCTRRSIALEAKYDPKIAVHRSSACQCMGITQPSTHGK